MLFDTDMLIWVQRGNDKAASLIEEEAERYIALQSYMELLQCAKDKAHQRFTKDFLASFGFIILPLTEKIGHRAAIYIEEYSLSSGLRAGDALVAATATENNLPLASSNIKHFRVVKDLVLEGFKPD